MKPVVEGVDRITEMFAKMPKEMNREMKSQMRKAAKPWLARLRSAIPQSEWKSLAKISIRSWRKTFTSCLVGFFGPADVHFQWMKLYWDNDGTLTRRDPSHTFDNPVKRVSRRRRNNVGQPAHNYFEKAMEGAADDIADKTIRGLESYIDRL